MTTYNEDPDYIEAILWVVINEDGDVTADADRDTAIERMRDDYGGDRFRIIETIIKTPRPKDYLAHITLDADDGRPVVAVSEES